MLNERRATTHWAKSGELARWFPRAVVEPAQIFVRDGNVYTSGGVTAGIDLALALVAEDHGRELSREVAKWLVIDLHRTGNQSQFGVEFTLPPDLAPRIDEAIRRVMADPAGDHTVTNLAEVVGVSRRHFARLFRAQTGTTPARFVESVRLNLAKTLLERGEPDHRGIATACGFASAEALRQSFSRRFGASPENYRRRFR